MKVEELAARQFHFHCSTIGLSNFPAVEGVYDPLTVVIIKAAKLHLRTENH